MNTPFRLDDMPIEFVVSVHLRNMILTFGEEQVLKSIELFFQGEIQKVEELKTNNGSK